MTDMHLSREYRRDAFRANIKRAERRDIALVILCGLIVACAVIVTGLKL